MEYRRKEGPKVTDITQIYCAGYKRLGPGGKAVFRARCKELLKNGDLYFSDLNELVFYAKSLELYWQYDQIVKEKGEVLDYEDRMGNTRYYPNPAVKMCRDALNDLMAIGAHFGFQPLSRKKLAMAADDSEDPVEALLKMVTNDRSRARKDS